MPTLIHSQHLTQHKLQTCLSGLNVLKQSADNTSPTYPNHFLLQAYPIFLVDTQQSPNVIHICHPVLRLALEYLLTQCGPSNIAIFFSNTYKGQPIIQLQKLFLVISRSSQLSPLQLLWYGCYCQHKHSPIFTCAIAALYAISHYSYINMGRMASQFTSLTIVYLTVYSDAECTGDQWIPHTIGQ